MKQNITDILKQALKLPPEARAALSGSLFDSLGESLDSKAESAWEAEIGHRLEESDEGKIKLIPWAEARKESQGSNVFSTG